MKKIVAILLALMLCLGAALAETADIIGTWYLNEMVSQGVSVNPASLGIDMTMTLNEDKTATTVIGEETMVSYWQNNGEEYFTPFGDGLLVFAPQDGNLVAEQDGVQMIFGREKEEVVTFVLGAVRTDATMADYNGTWNATLVDMMGIQMPVADIGMSMQIIVADGKVTVLEGTGEEMTTGEGTATAEGGVLSMLIESDTVATPLQLHEGDVLARVSDLGDGLTMSIYFEKVVE